MELLLWALALSVVVSVNFRAGRALQPVIGRLTLLVTSLPAVALVVFSGFRLAYALVNADETNRRFQEGDLTYFGADMAFGVSVVFGGLWIFLAYAAFDRGRSTQRPE